MLVAFLYRKSIFFKNIFQVQYTVYIVDLNISQINRAYNALHNKGTEFIIFDYFYFYRSSFGVARHIQSFHRTSQTGFSSIREYETQ